MAIDVKNPDHRMRLARALRTTMSRNEKRRTRRQNLIDIYKDSSDYTDLAIGTTDQDLGTLLNLFQKYVRGHLITTAFYLPKYAVNARTAAGRGLDARIEMMLGTYMEILNFNETQKSLALDSAFGWAVCKITNGPAPKGITAPVAPRAYRINPDNLIIDPSAPTFDEAAYVADVYLVPLNEAQAYEGFDPIQRANLQAYRDTSSGTRMVPEDYSADDIFAEPYTRLIDVYIPAKGCIYTWACNTDDMNQIMSNEPLMMRMTPINPYVILSLLNVPNQLEEIARLSSLRGLHLISNEMLHKGVAQARNSQRNPVAQQGDAQNLQTALDAGDNNPFYVEDLKKLGLYNIPGPDPSILQLSQMTSALFSNEAGNLEVALGQSTGASTAKQTEALISQISASQAIDRRAFELFLAEIGRRVATLAFHSEVLEVETIFTVPGTTVEVSRLWGPPQFLPRAASIDAFKFDVVPYSTAARTPEQRLAQLNQASQLVVTWMQAKAQGLPINLPKVMGSISKGFDLVPELEEWWSGEEPSPAQKTSDTYTSFAQEAQGSDVRYQGNQQSGAEAAFAGSAPPMGVAGV